MFNLKGRNPMLKNIQGKRRSAALQTAILALALFLLGAGGLAGAADFFAKEEKVFL